MNSLYNYLQRCNDFMGEIEIDQAFIDYREQMKWKFKQGNRTDEQFTMDRDCLIIEYSMVQWAMATEAYSKEYDFAVGSYNALVDVKIFDKWFNIPGDKLEWYSMNTNKGLLTHFAFYKWRNKPIKPLVVGDKVSFDLIEVSDSRHVLDNKSLSQYDGYYYTPRKK